VETSLLGRIDPEVVSSTPVTFLEHLGWEA